MKKQIKAQLKNKIKLLWVACNCLHMDKGKLTMISTRSLQMKIVVAVTLISLNTYANSSNWYLLRETTSSMLNSHNKAQPIAAYDTQAKCEAALDKAITTTAIELKANRVDNSVVSNSIAITYKCTLDKPEADTKFSKKLQTNKHNETTGNLKQGPHGEF